MAAVTDTSYGFVQHFDDFDRPVIGTLDWTINNGNAGTNFAINTQVNGVARGTVTSNSGADHSQIIDSITIKAATDKSGPRLFEGRVALHTSLSLSVFAGFASVSTVTTPIEWHAAAFSAVIDPDAAGFYWGAAGTSWHYGGVKNSVQTADGVARAGLIPVLDVFQTLRVSLDKSGNGSFYINGEIVKENIPNCDTPSVLKCTKFTVRDDGAAGSFDVDYRLRKYSRN